MQLNINLKTNTMSRTKSLKMKTIYSLFTFLVILSSCKKGEPSQNCSPSITTLSGTYKIVSLKYKAAASAQEIDYLSFLDDCEKDDQVKLNSNKTYNNIDAGVSCNPSTNNEGTWNLVGNKIESDGQIQGEIQSFDCSTLVVFSKDAVMPGDKLTFTFKKL